MLGASEIGWKLLGQISRRLATAYQAGIDLRRAIDHEAQLGSSQHQRHMTLVRQQVHAGRPLADSLGAAPHYFPSFFVEMVRVGEQTGKLDQVLPRLANYYDHLVALRRIFLAGIAWPTIQLFGAIVVIGILIVVLGAVGQATGSATDILGFGLVGMRGLMRYVTGLGALAATIILLWKLLTSGPWSRAIFQVLLRCPGLGTALKIQSLSRMAWALGLTLDTGMNVRRSMRMALESTQNAYYQQHAEPIDRALTQGKELHEALRATSAFPFEFVETLQVGEESGTVSEAMLRLADQYQEQAKRVAQSLTVAATILVWLFVAGIIIAMIFRIFGFYLQTIQSAIDGL